MSGAVEIAASAAAGFISAFVPVVNAESAVIASVLARPWLVVPVVLAAALGQSLGKLVLFEAARHGSSRLRHRHTRSRPTGALGRVHERLTRPATGIPLVLSSATLGLPPLALVSVAAGAAALPRRHFVAACFVGRTTRFAALAAPFVLLT